MIGEERRAQEEKRQEKEGVDRGGQRGRDGKSRVEMMLGEEDSVCSVRSLSMQEQRVNTPHPLTPEREPYKVKEEGCRLSWANPN